MIKNYSVFLIFLIFFTALNIHYLPKKCIDNNKIYHIGDKHQNIDNSCIICVCGKNSIWLCSFISSCHELNCAKNLTYETNCCKFYKCPGMFDKN